MKSKTSEHHSLGRSSVTKESLLAWYSNFKKFIEDKELSHVIQSPERIFNLDETAFYLNSNRGKFIGKKHECLQQVCTTIEKENVTVAINFSAAGEMAPPMVILKRQKLSKSLQQCVPLGMIVQRSSSGWMKGETFLYYLNEFKRYLVGKGLLNIKDNNQKIILFVDGHSSHLSYGASKYCEESGIVLYCLYPNATHVQQPADVGIMNSLQGYWAREVQVYRMSHTGAAITSEKFPAMAMKAIIQITAPVMKKAFECCGLYPFNPDRVNLKKLLSTYQQAPQPVFTYDVGKKLALEGLEKNLSEAELKQFKIWNKDTTSCSQHWCRLYEI